MSEAIALAMPEPTAWSENAAASRPAAEAPLMQAVGLAKTYHKGPVAVPVLRGVDFQFSPGEFVAIVGQSGSGKSTLLHLLAALDRPDSGEIHYGAERLDTASVRRRDQLRNQSFGVVFQFYHLLPELTAMENVLAPAMISHGPWSFLRQRRRLETRARELLSVVGLGERIHHRPREMSGGEMQRTAIARALFNEPECLFADEPTGNLDAETGGEITKLLTRLNRERGLTIVMVTHDAAVASIADRVVRLAAGRIEGTDAD